MADKVGSTAALPKHSEKSQEKKFIVAPEPEILCKMKSKCPGKEFIPAPPEDDTCACNICSYMKQNTLQKLYDALKYEQYEVTVPEETRVKAEVPIRRMLEISEKLKL